MKRIFKPIILFLIGGSIYISIEIIYRWLAHRPQTHWVMFLIGGIAFLCIGELNENLSWDMPFWLQDVIGTAMVLALEFTSGCILNLWLKLDIWDYSNLPFNLLGQVCLPFAFVWIILVAIAIVLDDWLRYWLFEEERPVYH